MLSVEEIPPGGRRRTLGGRANPEDTPAKRGRVLVAAGRLRGRGSRPVPAPEPLEDDLLALAVAVGVVS
jgi:hypothetical protein